MEKRRFLSAGCFVLAGAIVAGWIVLNGFRAVKNQVVSSGVRIEQTDADGVTLKMQPLAATASDVGAQRVTATVDPADAIYRLEWTISVGDSEIRADDISEYLSYDVVSSNAIELVCHKHFDGWAELIVEDAFSECTATASVSAWDYVDNDYFNNSDFSENTSGKTSFTLSVPYPPGQATGSGPLTTELVDDWVLYTEVDRTYDGVSVSYNGGRLYATFMPLTNWPSVTYGIVQEIPTYQGGPNASYTYFLPDTVWYMVIESQGEQTPALFNAKIREYGASAMCDFAVIQDGIWTRNGTTVIKFHVNDYSTYFGAAFGVGFSQTTSGYPGAHPYTMIIDRISCYQAQGG